MNCSEARLDVSALHDGQAVPPESAAHIAACPNCRRALVDFSQIAVELRLLAAGNAFTPTVISQCRFRWPAVRLPYAAVIALAACSVVAIATAALVRVQTSVLWFSWGYSLGEGAPSFYTPARAGFENTFSTLATVDGAPHAAALRLRVQSITENDVTLRARAVLVDTDQTPSGRVRMGAVPHIALDRAPVIHYCPGSSLSIPIEGSAKAFHLKGDVLDHQPQIAFGMPLIPPPGQLCIRSPMVTSNNQLLAEFDGASATTVKPGEAVVFSTADRTFAFALQPFTGAVKGRAEWGRISFRAAGTQYRLAAAAPVAGGNQPIPVWVRLFDSGEKPANCSSTCLGVEPAPSLEPR